MSVMMKDGVPLVQYWDGQPVIVCTTPMHTKDGTILEHSWCGAVIYLPHPYVITLEMDCGQSHLFVS